MRLLAAKRVRATVRLNSVAQDEDARASKKSRHTPPTAAAVANSGGAAARPAVANSGGAAARPPVRRNNGSAQANRQRGQNMNARARQQHQQRPNNKHRRDAGRAIDPYAFRMDSVGPPNERLTLAQYQHYRKHYLCFGCGSDEHLFSQCPKNPNRED
ncbi:hypothetical protein PLESTM_001787500 [Pleodorina starrii]|nr:hypothetical protein PLESTM_001787500 [Pleodorina starrii]